MSFRLKQITKILTTLVKNLFWNRFLKVMILVSMRLKVAYIYIISEFVSAHFTVSLIKSRLTKVKTC